MTSQFILFWWLSIRLRLEENLLRFILLNEASDWLGVTVYTGGKRVQGCRQNALINGLLQSFAEYILEKANLVDCVENRVFWFLILSHLLFKVFHTTRATPNFPHLLREFWLRLEFIDLVLWSAAVRNSDWWCKFSWLGEIFSAIVLHYFFITQRMHKRKSRVSCVLCILDHRLIYI